MTTKKEKAKAEHEKWLRQRGIHPDQIRARKKDRPKVAKVKKEIGYYEDKPLSGTPVLKKVGKVETSKFLETEKFKIEEGLRTAPRDLGSEREYDFPDMKG